MKLSELPVGEDAPAIVNAVVEVPYGSSNKIEYDAELGVFRLDRPLFASVHYPGEYGFLPGTLSRDGDPLDVLILVTHATFTGCLVRVRPIGVLEMVDQGVRDEKILAVGQASPVHKEVRGHKDLAPHLLREVEHFFSVYKELEGKKAKVRGWKGRGLAYRLIVQGRNRFAKAYQITSSSPKAM